MKNVIASDFKILAFSRRLKYSRRIGRRKRIANRRRGNSIAEKSCFHCTAGECVKVASCMLIPLSFNNYSICNLSHFSKQLSFIHSVCAFRSTTCFSLPRPPQCRCRVHSGILWVNCRQFYAKHSARFLFLLGLVAARKTELRQVYLPKAQQTSTKFCCVKIVKLVFSCFFFFLLLPLLTSEGKAKANKEITNRKIHVQTAFACTIKPSL